MKTSMLKADTHDISANVKEEIRKALRESHIENFKELTEFAQKKRNALLDVVRDEGVSDSDLHLIEESTKMDNADVFVAMDNIKMSDVYLNPDEFIKVISQAENPRDSLLLASPYIGAKSTTWDRIIKLKKEDWKDGKIYYEDIDEWVESPLDLSKLIKASIEADIYYGITNKTRRIRLISDGTILKTLDVYRKEDGRTLTVYGSYIKASKEVHGAKNFTPISIRNMGIVTYINRLAEREGVSCFTVAQTHAEEIGKIFNVTERTIRSVLFKLHDYLVKESGGNT